MSETKFTPGPWVACGDRRGGCVCGMVYGGSPQFVVAAAIGRGDEGYTLGEGLDESSEEYKANARLIAAAPQMYEALSRYVAIDDADECGDELARAARAALAAATGESQ